jgi:hypothetical protein
MVGRVARCEAGPQATDRQIRKAARSEDSELSIDFGRIEELEAVITEASTVVRSLF